MPTTKWLKKETFFKVKHTINITENNKQTHMLKIQIINNQIICGVFTLTKPNGYIFTKCYVIYIICQRNCFISHKSDLSRLCSYTTISMIFCLLHKLTGRETFFLTRRLCFWILDPLWKFDLGKRIINSSPSSPATLEISLSSTLNLRLLK